MNEIAKARRPRMLLLGILAAALVWTAASEFWRPRGWPAPELDARRSLGEWVASTWRAIGVPLVLAFAATVLATGWRGLCGALVFLLRGRSSSPRFTARGLRSMETSLIAACVLMSLVGIVVLFMIVRAATSTAVDQPGADALGLVRELLLISPLTACVLGRLWLGSAAEAAARVAGLSPPRHGRRDWMLLVLLVPPVTFFLVLAWEAPRIG